jgi:uncharacterized protein (TIGR03086 family)
MIDIRPAADRTVTSSPRSPTEQLDLPPPCPGSRLGDLIDHVGSLSRPSSRRPASRRGRDGPPPKPSATNLGPGWRDQVAGDLHALADAWREPEAWQGFTTAGGIDLPAEVAGLVVLDELVVHGWDIAVASGQPYRPAVPEVDAAMAFVGSFEAPRDGSLFGPVVPVADTAPPLDRLIGLTGRDPGWQPPA